MIEIFLVFMLILPVLIFIFPRPLKLSDISWKEELPKILGWYLIFGLAFIYNSDSNFDNFSLSLDLPDFEIFLYLALIQFLYFYPTKYNLDKRTNSLASNLISLLGQIIAFVSAIYYYGFVILTIFYVNFLSSMVFLGLTFIYSMILTSTEAMILAHRNSEKLFALTIVATTLNPILIFLSLPYVNNYLF